MSIDALVGNLGRYHRRMMLPSPRLRPSAELSHLAFQLCTLEFRDAINFATTTMPTHLDTPKKSRILGAYDVVVRLERKGTLSGKKGATAIVSEAENVSKRQVQRIVSAQRERRHPEIETRGGFRTGENLTRKQTKRAVEVIENNGYDGHNID